MLKKVFVNIVLLFVLVVLFFSLGFTATTLYNEYQMTGKIIARGLETEPVVEVILPTVTQETAELEVTPSPTFASDEFWIVPVQVTSTPMPEMYFFSFLNKDIEIHAGSEGLEVKGLSHNSYTEAKGHVVVDDWNVYENVNVFITWADALDKTGSDLFIIEVENILSVKCDGNVCEKPVYINNSSPQQ